MLAEPLESMVADLNIEPWDQGAETATVSACRTEDVGPSSLSGQIIAWQLISRIREVRRSRKAHTFLSYISTHPPEVASASLFQDVERNVRDEENAAIVYFHSLALLSRIDMQGREHEQSDTEALKLRAKFRLYQETAGELLVEHGYTESKPYVDSFGDLAADYTRGADRITLVLDDRAVQILSVIAGEFAERQFENPELAIFDIYDYVRKLAKL